MREHHRCRKINEQSPDIENGVFSKRNRFIHVGYFAVAGDSKLWGVPLTHQQSQRRLWSKTTGCRLTRSIYELDINTAPRMEGAVP
jgi:hypothetical protein